MAPGKKSTGKAPANEEGSRQPSVEDESPSASGGEIGGEIVHSNAALSPPIPGFSNEQMNALTRMISGMLSTALERHFGPPLEQQQQFNTPEQFPQQNTQPHVLHERPLKAEEVGYFDPEYQQEQGATSTPGPIANAGKYVVYRDVYIFVDRLKDLAHTQNSV